MIKLIATDLDGTLLDEEKKVGEEDKQILRKVTEMGVDVCLASGRMYHDLKWVAETIGIKTHFISQNGSFTETKEGKLLDQSAFTPALAQEVYGYIRNLNLYMTVGFKDRLVTPSYKERATEANAQLFTEVRQVPDIGEKFEVEPPQKFSLVGEQSRLESLQQDLAQRFSGRVELYISDTHYLDVMPAGVSKGKALQILTDHLGVKPEEVLCIGDAFNDVSMFERFATYSFAMEQGLPAVKQKAAFTVGSVAQGIRQSIKGI